LTVKYDSLITVNTDGVGEGCGGVAIADGGELTSVAQSGATVHGFQLCGHGEKEESEVTSMGLISWAEKTSCGLAMAGNGEGLPELMGMALVTIIQDDGGMGRKRGARRSSLSKKNGAEAA
jgi:hypothetical protein